jgi:hypothetical protein
MLRSKFFNYAQFSEARRRELNAQDFWTRVPRYNCFAGYPRTTPQKNSPRFSIWTQSDSMYFEEIFDHLQTSINPSNPHLQTPRWAQCHTVQGNWMRLTTTLISCPPLVLSQGPWASHACSPWGSCLGSESIGLLGYFESVNLPPERTR